PTPTAQRSFPLLIPLLPSLSYDIMRSSPTYIILLLFIVLRWDTGYKPITYPRKSEGLVETYPIATNDNDNSARTMYQEFPLQIDTGSSTSWVVSSQCNRDICTAVKRLDTSSLPTAEVGKSASIEFGRGLTVSGRVVRDVFSAGFLAVKNQTFIAADDVTAPFPGSGILGLGFGAKSPVPDKPNTIFENMVEQNLIAEPVFGVRLVSHGGGEIMFGGIDLSIIKGAIQYLPVTSLLEWEIPVKGIKFANKIITPPTRFIVDTGTTVNIIPEKYAEILFAEIPGSGIDNETGLRTVPCDIDETFTTSFIIGNEEYIMPAKDLAFQRINNTNNCITGTQGGELDDQWLLGDTFIKNFYVAFRLKPERSVGIARRVDV
ncbi:2530_t:CDS:2, partial [Paraglomus brasilianum]